MIHFNNDVENIERCYSASSQANLCLFHLFELTLRINSAFGVYFTFADKTRSEKKVNISLKFFLMDIVGPIPHLFVQIKIK